jgi:multiple sugar transport system permease protein
MSSRAAPTDVSAPMSERRPWLGERERFMLLLIAPAVLIMIAFQVVPIFMGANASFRDWAIYDPKKTWVGLTHYIYVLTDPIFVGQVLPNTFLLMICSVALSLIFGLALALMLNKRFPGRGVVQTIILLPLMVAPVIAAIMMRWMFNDQFGIVTVIVDALGFTPPPWLAQRWTAFAVIVGTDVWLWTPWFAIILLAGLKSLPREPFEAAAIDGATAWRVFRYLTLPMLRPVIVVCVVIRMIDAFRTFDVVWTLTGGGPARGTEVFSVYTYMETFQYLNFGRGTASAMIGTVIILVVGLFLYRMLNRVVEVSR